MSHRMLGVETFTFALLVPCGFERLVREERQLCFASTTTKRQI